MFQGQGYSASFVLHFLFEGQGHFTELLKWCCKTEVASPKPEVSLGLERPKRVVIKFGCTAEGTLSVFVLQYERDVIKEFQRCLDVKAQFPRHVRLHATCHG